MTNRKESIMKTLLTKFTVLIVTLMCAVNLHADTGFFYNPDRSGEGIIVTVDEELDLLAFAFFTYYDSNFSSEIPPVVSPRPPTTEPIVPYCEIEPVIVSQTILPVVSPRPPPTEDVNSILYGGVQAWFIGFGDYLGDTATGNLYYNKAKSYPYSFDGALSDESIVATFLLERSGEGFAMSLDCNPLLPTSFYMCSNVMQFNKLLIGK
jgi:hypothetical protein